MIFAYSSDTSLNNIVKKIDELNSDIEIIPVVHTTDKKGNAIDKIACSEFWKERDSYVQLQNAFHSYVVAHGF